MGNIKYFTITATAVKTNKTIAPKSPKPSPVALAAEDDWQYRNKKADTAILDPMRIVPMCMLTRELAGAKRVTA